MIAVPSLYIAEVIRRMDLPSKIKIMIGHTPAVVEQADAAWIASGTATLEAALLNTPHCIGLSNWCANLSVCESGP